MSSPERLIFDSFLHSQTNMALQRGIFRYLEQNEVIEEAECLRVLDRIIDRVVNYTGGRFHKKARTSSPIAEAIHIKNSSSYEGLEGEDLILSIRQAIALQDRTYVVNAETPRPPRPVYQGRRSPSHLMLFGALGMTTGIEEYDKLYADIVKIGEEMNPEEASDVEQSAHAHAYLNPEDREGLETYLGFFLSDIDTEQADFLTNREAS